MLHNRIGWALATMLLSLGCASAPNNDNTEELFEDVEDPVLDSKSDYASSKVSLRGSIEFGQQRDAQFDNTKYHGYSFQGKKGASIQVELLGDPAQQTDTVVMVYGPKTADGWSGKPVARDDDSAGGKFSKLTDFSLPEEGEYLILVTCKNLKYAGKSYHLLLACTDQQCDSSSVPANPKVEWTVLVYGSFDTHDNGGIPSSLSAMAQKITVETSQVYFLYLEDLAGDGNTKLWRVKRKKTEVVQDYGELHLGRPETLTAILQEVRTAYPSNQFFLNLIGHTNAGLAAFLPDYTPASASWEQERMMYWQVREAILAGGGGVDLLGLSGCGTGDLEIVAALSPAAHFLTGLQEESFGYTDVRWADSLARNPSIDPRGLAWRVAQGSFQNGWNNQGQPSAVGAYNTSALPAVTQSFTALNSSLNAHLADQGTLFAQARTTAQEMMSGGFEYLVDAWDFADRLEEAGVSGEVLDNAKAFRAALKQFLVAGGPPDCADEEYHARAHGLNLLFMRPGNTDSRFGTPEGFDQASAWPAAETSFYEQSGWRTFVTSIQPLLPQP